MIAFAVRDKFEFGLILKLLNDVADRVNEISLIFLNLLLVHFIAMHEDGQHLWFSRKRVEPRPRVLEAIHLFDLFDMIFPPL